MARKDTIKKKKRVERFLNDLSFILQAEWLLAVKYHRPLFWGNHALRHNTLEVKRVPGGFQLYWKNLIKSFDSLKVIEKGRKRHSIKRDLLQGRERRVIFLKAEDKFLTVSRKKRGWMYPEIQAGNYREKIQKRVEEEISSNRFKTALKSDLIDEMFSKNIFVRTRKR